MEHSMGQRVGSKSMGGDAFTEPNVRNMRMQAC